METFTFLDDILKEVGVIVDRDIGEEVKHHRITALVMTMLRRFEHTPMVEFEDNKTLFVDLEYYKPHARCATCFSLEHKE